MTAAEQLRRVLHLLPRVADGESHSLDDLLAEAGVEMSTLMRDLQLITERYDSPGGFVEGVQIHMDGSILEVASSHFRRPMGVTAPELCALELGLAMLRSERPADDWPAIQRARERLHQAIIRLPDADRSPAHDHLHASADGRHASSLAVIREAMRAHRKLRLRYRKGSDVAATERTVRPYSIVHAAGTWYLVAHCESGDGIRVFRVDRMEELTPLEDVYRVPAGFDVDRLLRDDRLFASERPRTLVVRYSERVARWVAEREGVEPDADGTLTVEHPLADTDWALRHVLQYGPDAEVLAPADVRAAMVRRLSEMLAVEVPASEVPAVEVPASELPAPPGG